MKLRLYSLSLLCLFPTFYLLIRAIAYQLYAPTDLFLEWPLLSAVRDIQQGENVFDWERVIGTPFNLHLYTPFFSYFCALFPESTEHPFYTIRLVSTSFWLACVAIVLAFGGTKRLWLSMILIACVLSTHVMLIMFSFARCDCAAMFFSLCAAYVLWKCPQRWWLFVPLSLLAFMSKQTFIAIGVAGLITYALQDRKQFISVLVSYAFLGVILSAGAYVYWGEGFFQSILNSKQHGWSWSVFAESWAVYRKSIFFLFLAALNIGAIILAVQRCQYRFWRQPILLYILLSWCVLNLGSGKFGASNNYLIEICFATPLLILSFEEKTNWLATAFSKIQGYAVAVVILLVCFGFEFWKYPEARYLFSNPNLNQMRAESRLEHLQHLTRLGIEEDDAILNIFLFSGFNYGYNCGPNDSIAYRYLWGSGVFPKEPVLDTVRAQDYRMVLMPLPKYWPAENWEADLIETIQEYYEPVYVGDIMYFMPIQKQG